MQWTAPLGLWCFLMAAPLASAQSTDIATACKDAVNGRLAQEQRIYRSALFGRKDAASEPVNAARHDTDGNAWIKSGRNAWVSQSPGFGGTTWSDAQMNSRTEWEGQSDPFADQSWLIRKGIFETKAAMTSELVPPLTQSFRALQCRIAAVCETTRRSLRNEPAAGGAYAIALPGCMPLRMKPLAACTREATTVSVTDLPNQTALDSIARTYCDPVGEQLLDREAELLKLVTTYDAAYRTLLQFAGQFDVFAGRFRGDLIDPIRQSMSLVSQLSRIPCFLSQCNE